MRVRALPAVLLRVLIFSFLFWVKKNVHGQKINLIMKLFRAKIVKEGEMPAFF